MTFAEIQTAVGANPALLGEIAQGFGQNDDFLKVVVPGLSQKGFVVRTQADEQGFLNTYKTQVIEQEIPARVREVHDRYDEDIFNLTGERKAPTEKTYDFLKRKITELKTTTVADPVLKEQLVTLQKSLEQKDNEHKSKITELESSYFKKELNGIVSNSLDALNLAIPSHLKTDDEKQKYIASQKSMIRRELLETIIAKKDNDGNIVFYDGDKPMTSTTDGKALSASDIIKARFGYYISAETQKTSGSGTGNNGQQGGMFTTKEQVMEHLKGKGLTPLTKVFGDEYAKIIKEQGIIN